MKPSQKYEEVGKTQFVVLLQAPGWNGELVHRWGKAEVLGGPLALRGE